MPRDNLAEQETPPPTVKKPTFLDRMFDGKSDGRFVKRILSIMLIAATIVQPFSLVYTAYNGHGSFDASRWWEYMPALAVLLFIALDWTIMPLSYFFATTREPGLKIMLAIMLTVVAAGAFDGYFVATERFIAMRLEEITRYALKVEAANTNINVAKAARGEALEQQKTAKANQIEVLLELEQWTRRDGARADGSASEGLDDERALAHITGALARPCRSGEIPRKAIALRQARRHRTPANDQASRSTTRTAATRSWSDRGPHPCRGADAGGASSRRTGCRGPYQPRGRRGAVPRRADRRDASLAHLRQARRALADGAGTEVSAGRAKFRGTHDFNLSRRR